MEQDQDQEHRFPLYATPRVMAAVQNVVENRVERLSLLKRPSKKQRTELELLRAAARELAAVWGDAEPTQ